MDLYVAHRVRGARYGMNRTLFLDLALAYPPADHRLLLTCYAEQQMASPRCRWALDLVGRRRADPRPPWASSLPTLTPDDVEQALSSLFNLDVLTSTILAAETVVRCNEVEPLLLAAVGEIDREWAGGDQLARLGTWVRQVWPHTFITDEWRGEFDPTVLAPAT